MPADSFSPKQEAKPNDLILEPIEDEEDLDDFVQCPECGGDGTTIEGFDCDYCEGTGTIDF